MSLLYKELFFHTTEVLKMVQIDVEFYAENGCSVVDENKVEDEIVSSISLSVDGVRDHALTAILAVHSLDIHASPSFGPFVSTLEQLLDKAFRAGVEVGIRSQNRREPQ